VIQPYKNNLRRLLVPSLVTVVLIAQGCAPASTNDTTNFDQSKQEVSSNVIYGSDGRLDLYQVSDDNLKRLADSTVALIANKDLVVSGSSLAIKGSSFGSAYQLCNSEKFREQSTAAFCSGSLVGEDTIITAGHCIENASDCAGVNFVFGYALKAASVLPTSIASNEVYKCKSIIKQVLTSGGADFAVIKLDRKVSNHAPLSIRQSGSAAVGDQLVVIGHPTGLPTKITTGGKIRSVANADFLVASIDTYGGNSGSAVFNASTGLIEGILVRGEQDFVQQGSCTVSKVCQEDSCRGEDITKISVLKQYIPNGSTPPVDPPPPVSSASKYAVTANLSIPDNKTAGIKSALSADAIPGSRKVYVSVNITHTYIGDLVIKVTSPSGKVATLHSRAGGGTDDLNKVYEVTSVLGSENKLGIYQITVQDLAARDTGFLNSWILEFK
jgi:S1-C subfamily serine protease